MAASPKEDEYERLIMTMKREKARLKTNFTRARKKFSLPAIENLSKSEVQGDGVEKSKGTMAEMGKKEYEYSRNIELEGEYSRNIELEGEYSRNIEVEDEYSRNTQVEDEYSRNTQIEDEYSKNTQVEDEYSRNTQVEDEYSRKPQVEDEYSRNVDVELEYLENLRSGRGSTSHENPRSSIHGLFVTVDSLEKMATGLTVQRSATCLSPMASPGRAPNLPVIEHPMSRLGDRRELAVRGSATHSGALRRSNTDIGPRPTFKEPAGTEGKKGGPDRMLNWPPGVDINPPFTYKEKPFKGYLPDIGALEDDKIQIPQKVDKFPKVGHIPKLPPLPSIEEQEEFLKGPGKPHVKSKEYNWQPRTTSELIDIIRDKFGQGFYGIRHLFKSNDPSGHGNVSREGLQRILYTLCGYITPDQYSKLLKELNLEAKKSIHFDHFVQYFKESEDSKNWVNAMRTQSIHVPDSTTPEGYLRRGDMRIHDPYTSMPFSDAIFKEKCRSKNFDAHKVFPQSVFEPSGLIIPPQLREAYATLGIYMTDEDFDKLWKRYDREGTKAVPAADFFRQVGLDPQGRPRQAAPYTPRGAAYPLQRPHSEISHTNGMETSTELKKILKKEKPENIPKPTVKVPTATDEEKKEAKPEAKTEVKETKVEIKRPPKQAPRLENVVDCLHYKFEEGYQAMLTAFQLFDFLNDNYVSKIDFRRVLQEFGFSISPAELDDFLKKSGMRAIKGQVNYREFLLKYQNRSENSITSKVAKDTNHSFHTDGTTPASNLSSEGLEARLVEFFHGDFIKILSHFRQSDKYSLGVITAHEFRSGIERRLGYTISENQWDRLKQDVGEDKDGLIPYTKFLELFDILPGSWNIKQEGNIQVLLVSPTDMPTPSAVDRLKERAKTEMVPPPPPAKTEDGLRTLEELNHRSDIDEIKKRLDDVFSTRFHTFDKHFKAMDRKMTGRMSKWQFGALLKMCGLDLHPKELDRIWATLNVSTDGMYSYATLIQHFIHFKVPHEAQKENIVYEDTKELVETARRIQRERRMEQMQRDHLARQKARESNEEWKPEPSRTTQPMTSLSRASTMPASAASRASFASVQSVRTKSLLVKIRSDVVDNWDGLKSVFKYIDRHGTASITINEMKDVMANMHFSLDEEEKTELCKRFDMQKNGRFNYLTFMKCYAKKQEAQARTKPYIYSKYTHQFQAQLLKEHKTIRRAFKKLDQGKKGYLNTSDFRRALTMCNVSYSNEDMYHIMTEFDYEMTGRISYDTFLRSILTA